MPHVYTARNTAAHSTAITILQLGTAAGHPIEILRGWVTQATSTTSAQTHVQLLRESNAITGTGVTEIEHDTDGPASTVTALHTATAGGTDGDVVIQEGFNVLNGWLYLPVPEERIWVPVSSFISIAFPDAPPNVTYDYGLTWREY